MLSKHLLKLQKTNKENYEFLLECHCNNLSILIKWALGNSRIIHFDSLAVASFKFAIQLGNSIQVHEFTAEFDERQSSVLVQEVIDSVLTKTDLSNLLTLMMNTKIKLDKVEGEYSTHLYNEQQ